MAKTRTRSKTNASTKEKPKIIAFEAPVAITAAADDSDDSGSKVPRFDVTAYTGGPMNIFGYDLPVVVDLDGMTFAKSLVGNLDHERRMRVGHVTEKSTDGGRLQLGGLVSAATDAAREVAESAKNGFVWQASIEAMPERIVEIDKGESTEANGRTFDGPLYLIQKSRLSGFAFVSRGADEDTTASIAASAGNTRNKNMKKEVRDWLAEMMPSIDIEALSEEEVANIEADYEGRGGKRPEPKRPDVEAESPFERRKRERDRREEVREIADKFCEQRPWDIEAIEKMYDHAIEKGMSAKDFKMELYESSIPVAHAPMRPKVRDKEMSGEVLEAAVCLSAGMSGVDDKFTDQTLQTAKDRFPNGVGLQELYLVCARANGLHERITSQVTLEVQQYAYGMNRPAAGPGIQAAGFSTLSLPGILNNVANKFLLDGWGGGEMTWSAIAGRRPVRDFKQAESYRLSGNLKYEKVGGDGELKHGTVDEKKYTAQADTYGKLFAVTRRDIINDDLGALTQVPFELGVGASDAFNEVFWTLFLDNSTFFTAGNNNVSTGANSALSLTGLTEAKKTFRLQTKPNGTPLGIMPAILLVPPALEATARELMNSQFIITGADTTRPSTNIWQGSYRIESSAYMEDANLTGNSASAWYLLAEPVRMPVITASFLNGRESPVVETADAPFNVLGMQMRAYHDFGADLHEFRGGVRSAGS